MRPSKLFFCDPSTPSTTHHFQEKPTKSLKLSEIWPLTSLFCINAVLDLIWLANFVLEETTTRRSSMEKPSLQSKFTVSKSKFFPAKIPLSKVQKKNLAGK
jgi:hypothetical protein